MKTRKPKITFTVQLHEMEDLRWMLRLQRNENGHYAESTGVAIEAKREWLEGTSKYLASTVGGAEIEVRTFEELLPDAIAMHERMVANYQKGYDAATDDAGRDKYHSLLCFYGRELNRLRAWTRDVALLAKAA